MEDGSRNYFISYSYIDGSCFGFGNIEMKLRREILSLDDIKEIEQKIAKSHNHTTVSVINFKIF